MASASAAERSQSDESLRNRRGEQVVLTFSGQVSSSSSSRERSAARHPSLGRTCERPCHPMLKTMVTLEALHTPGVHAACCHGL